MYPRNPHYRTKEQRHQTFANFPTHFKATHEEFADAGTFVLSSFFIFPPIFHISTHFFFKFPPNFSYIALDHDESTYVDFLWRHSHWFLTILCLIDFSEFQTSHCWDFSLFVFFPLCTHFFIFPPIFPNFRLFLQISAHFSFMYCSGSRV